MNAQTRRLALVNDLRNKACPINASTLAAKYNVSRQIIVGDIALLRASGLNILATPKGYLMENAQRQTNFLEQIIVCKHSDKQTLEELYTVVDFGGSLIDVIVEHPIYGEIRAPLHITCRADADDFTAHVKQSGSHLLSSLTDGIHLHTIRAPNQQVMQRILDALTKLEILMTESK